MEKGRLLSKQKPRKGIDGSDRKTGGKNHKPPVPSVQRETRDKSTKKFTVFSKSHKAGKKHRLTSSGAPDKNETPHNVTPPLPPKTYKYTLNTALNEIQVHRNPQTCEEIHTDDINVKLSSTSEDTQPDRKEIRPQMKDELEEEVEEGKLPGREEVDGCSQTMTHSETQKTHQRIISACSIGSFHLSTVELSEELFRGEEWAPFLGHLPPAPEDSEQPDTNSGSLEPNPTPSDEDDDSDTEYSSVLEHLYLKLMEQPAPSPVHEELPESEAEPPEQSIDDILKSVKFIEENPKEVEPEPEKEELIHPLPPKLVTSSSTATLHRVYRSSVFYKVPPPGQEPQLDPATGGAKTTYKKRKLLKKQSDEETDKTGSLDVGPPVQLSEELSSGETQKTPPPAPGDSDQPVPYSYYLKPDPAPSEADASDSGTAAHTPVLKDIYLKIDEPRERAAEEKSPESEAESLGPNTEDSLKSVTFTESEPKEVEPEPEKEELLHPLPPKLVTSSSTAALHRVFRSSVFYKVPPPGQEPQLDPATDGAKMMSRKKAAEKKQPVELKHRKSQESERF